MPDQLVGDVEDLEPTSFKKGSVMDTDGLDRIRMNADIQKIPDGKGIQKSADTRVPNALPPLGGKSSKEDGWALYGESPTVPDA